MRERTVIKRTEWCLTGMNVMSVMEPYLATIDRNMYTRNK